MIVTAAGAGMDLSRAYLARQKLSEVATLACQYASRPSILQTSLASYTGSNGGTSYVTAVNNYITQSLSSQNFILSQTNGSPFTYTQGGAANVTLTATVPTTFMQIAQVTTIPITATSHCYDSPSSVPQRTPDSTATPYVVQESFEAGGSGVRYINPNGTVGNGNPTPSAFTNTVNYTGSKGTQWYTTGFCLEQDLTTSIKPVAFDGNFSVELDCENGTNSKGNSSISTKVYLSAGSYELRFGYASRVFYLDYGSAYICGSTASDVSWANSLTSYQGPVTNALRDSQMNVYLDLNTTGSPPTHTTIDGTQTLAGSNLIDVCVYGQNWLERSVAINVTTAGYYWLSFAADGQNDSFGAQLDNVRLCANTCPGSVQDNYAQAWAAGALLFEDTFESPTYSFSSGYNNNGNANNFYGSSNYWDEYGWGWANAPTNQIQIWGSQCPQGTQCIMLGWNNSSQTLISKPFLLVPGYYQVSYMYQSKVVFSSGVSNCVASPVTTTTLPTGSGTGTDWNSSYNWGSTHYDTNAVAMFMSHAQMASTPNTGNAIGSTTKYTNPDGSVTTTPTYPPNSTSTPTRVALLDVCSYSKTPQTRTATVFIQKPAYYWLTFSSLGTADGNGGIVDDVKITALGSPYMNSPPANAVTIPVPDPQPGATVSFTGFSITADRLTP